MKKLIIILLTTTFISCSGSIIGGGYEICVISIKYHNSSNCDDNIEYGFASNYLDASRVITEIEGILSEAEIGECVLVNFKSVFHKGNRYIGNVYIVNDSDKSWFFINEYCN